MDNVNIILQAAAAAFIGGGITAVSAVAAIKVHIFYIRRDVDNAHSMIKKIQSEIEGLTL